MNNNLLRDLNRLAVLGGAYKSGTAREEEEVEEEEEEFEFDNVVVSSPSFNGSCVGSISIASSEP